MRGKLWVVGLCAVVAVACGSSGSNVFAGDAGGASNGGTGGTGICSPGDTRVCVGPGACHGGQACGANGTWSACDCGSGGRDAGSGGSGGTMGGGGSGGTMGGGGSGGTMAGGGSGGTMAGGGGSGGTMAGGGGSGGTISVGGSGGTISVGGSAGSGGSQGCTATTYVGAQVPLAMYIMMDKSGSMQGTNWDGVKAALTTFVNSGTSVAGIGVGIQFFPLGTTCAPTPPCTAGCVDLGGICTPSGSGTAECDVNTYLPPPVTIQTLPGVAQKIIDAMAAQTPGGGTPTLPAMQSAEQATQAYAKQDPARKVIIVLATDGEPNDCNSTVANVAAEAASGFNATPSVQTFVIGIGNVANLDTIAKAGGTNQAFVVSSSNVSTQFLDAMTKIRQSAPGCGFMLPTPTSGTIDYQKVNVVYKSGSGTSSTIYYVSSSAKCGSGASWYYDNPTSPKRIVLCPASCSAFKSGGGEIDIQLGCATMVAP